MGYKNVVALIALAAGAMGMSVEAVAQNWPTKAVRIIVPYTPGGGNDNLARLFAQKFSEQFRQPFVVENKPGAGTLIGADAAAKSAPDGYTLLLSSIVTHALSPALYPKVPYDPIKDFTPITILAIAPTVLVVNNGFPAKTVPDIIALAKASPGKYTFASGGSGATPHISGEIFKVMTGTDLLHVPYKGGAPAIADLMAGQIDMIFDTAASAMPYVRSGRLRAIAIATPKRDPDFPELPTFAEQGLPNFTVNSWYSLHAPAGTPREIVLKLQTAVVNALKDPDVIARLKSLNAEPGGMSPDEFAVYQKAELDRYSAVIKKAGIKLE